MRIGDVAGRRVALVGVGTAFGHAPRTATDPSAVELMIAAAARAGDDSGASLLPLVQRVYVTQGTWQCRDAGRLIARAVGAPNARSILVRLGIPQEHAIDQALAAIAAGEIDVALVVGGEAKARDDAARRAAVTLEPEQDPGTDPDEIQTPQTEIVAAAEIAARFVVPVEQYAAIDNALRSAEGLSVTEQYSQIDSLWSRFDAVAMTNPQAAFAAGRTAEQLRSTEDGNRPLAFPYNKWHATQWGVDQAAALLLCADEVADRLGVPATRRVYPLVSLSSSHSVSLSKRRWLHRWPAMAALGQVAEAHIGRPLADLEFAEVYSCFPAAVRVQQRELGLPLGGTPTITGGMPFAGGPFNNFVFQATAAMAQRLRSNPGAMGLVTTVSGLLTKPGLAVWSATPSHEMLVGDLAEQAAVATPVVDTRDNFVGAATVATYTVRFDRDGPTEVVVVGDLEDGQRVVGVTRGREAIERALDGSIIGTIVVLNT
jgi:acetyl-CoA C-acetyltransferase